MTTQKLLGYVRRACQDYDMIKDGDSIAVGLSGGKDSISLLVALNAMQRFYPARYELTAISVSLGINGTDWRPAIDICKKLGVSFHLVETDIAEVVFDIRSEKNPCALCSKMRKAALNNRAKELLCNKIALGHNKDDVCQTFFLSLFYEGRINTFSPVTHWDRIGLIAIRPLIYAPEKDIKSYIAKSQIETVINQCPVSGKTKREDMREFINERNGLYGNFCGKIFNAIQQSEINGWKRSKKDG